MHCSRIRYERSSALILFVVLVASCATCSSSDDLRSEFAAAAMAGGQSVSTQDAAERPLGYRSPACIFGAKHGSRPIALYREIAQKNCSSSDVAEMRLAVGALEALACSGSRDGVRVADGIFRDPRAEGCRLGAMNAMVELSGKPTGQALGELLLDPDARRFRVHILSIMPVISDPSALPYIEEAARHPESAKEGRLITRVQRLVSDPTHCILDSKRKTEWGQKLWECQYRCSGARSSVLAYSAEECADPGPNPNWADGGR